MESKILTPEGLKKLKDELEDLKNVQRPQLAERIKLAKEFGDLSENAEYHDARELQSFMEGRILELEQMIKTSVVVQSNSNRDIVGVGSIVEVERDGHKQEYNIVGSTEADPANRKISLESPIGQALMDHRLGDEVLVDLPSGQARYTITKIK